VHPVAITRVRVGLGLGLGKGRLGRMVVVVVMMRRLVVLLRLLLLLLLLLPPPPPPPLLLPLLLLLTCPSYINKDTPSSDEGEVGEIRHGDAHVEDDETDVEEALPLDVKGSRRRRGHGEGG